MPQMSWSLAALTSATLTLGACMSAPPNPPDVPPASAPAPAATATAGGTESTSSSTGASGWRALFDGTSLAAWRGYRSAEVPAGWHVVNGVLRKEGSRGDLVSKDEFGDFELEVEWKLGKAGNSGIFYRATEEYEHIYWSGPEYQLLDDENAADGHLRLTSAGAAYALYPAPAGIIRGADQWNTARIVARGSHVEHWANGQKLLEYDLGSPDWEAKVKSSKFVEWPHYGRAPRGHIGIQGDHEGTLEVRAVRIRPLI
ncbi:MAG: DUF1080 domain-containing protein [Gemmatimonadaceae bacterium]